MFGRMSLPTSGSALLDELLDSINDTIGESSKVMNECMPLRFHTHEGITSEGDLVTLSLPGISKEEVKITRLGQILSIKATKDQNPCKDRYFKFKITAGVDLNRITAKMANGLLEITLPLLSETVPEQTVEILVQ